MTKEQTNSWVEEFEKEYPNLNVEEENMGTITSYSAKNHVRNFISKTISQEKEKWVKQTEKDIIKIIEEWASTPDEEAKMKTYVADYFNLLQNK